MAVGRFGDRRLGGVARLAADPPPAYPIIASVLIRTTKVLVYQSFGCIDNRRSFNTKQNIHTCNLPLYMTLYVEPTMVFSNDLRYPEKR